MLLRSCNRVSRVCRSSFMKTSIRRSIQTNCLGSSMSCMKFPVASVDVGKTNGSVTVILGSVCGSSLSGGFSACGLDLLSSDDDGLKAVATAAEANDEAPALVEDSARAVRRGPIWKKAIAMGKSISKKIKDRLTGVSKSRKITGKIDTSDDGCVMCQYVVERMEVNVHQSGIFPGASLTAGPSPASHVYLEESSTLKFPTPYDHAMGGAIEGTRANTRLQRQAERQKYNEIWRVTDLTLDDACEESMPNVYYSYCKALYQEQAGVVDGLRLQYRPSDICYRIGMCSSKSYITKGVHSRFPQAKK